MLYVAAILWVSILPMALELKAPLVGLLVLNLVVAKALIHRWQKRAEMSVLVTLIMLFIAIGFVIKLPFLIAFPESSWISRSLVPSEVAAVLAGPSYLLFSLGYLSFVAGLWMHPKRSVGASLLRTERHSGKLELLYLVLICLIMLRIVAQYLLGIGLPGVIPTYLGIPYLTGIVSLLAGPGCFAMANIVFYLAASSGRLKHLGISGLLLLLVISTSVLVGWKQELIFGPVILFFYFMELQHLFSPSTRRLLLVIGALLSGLVLTIYPFVNEIRFALLSGSSLVEAILDGIVNTNDNDKMVVIEILNRITGLDAFVAAITVLDTGSLGIASFFGSGINDAFKEVVFGRNYEDVATAFGITQFAALYLIGGIAGLGVGSFTLGFIFSRTFNFLINLKYLKNSVKKALVPLLALFFVNQLLGGGSVLLSLKELFITIIVASVISLMTAERRKHALVS